MKTFSHINLTQIINGNRSHYYFHNMVESIIDSFDQRTSNIKENAATALGLSSAATLADIKKAFRLKASSLHPDKNSALDAAERFRAVQEAYSVLSDAEKRRAYDDNRRRNLLDSPIDTAREIWTNYFDQVLDAAGHQTPTT